MHKAFSFTLPSSVKHLCRIGMKNEPDMPGKAMLSIDFKTSMFGARTAYMGASAHVRSLDDLEYPEAFRTICIPADAVYHVAHRAAPETPVRFTVQPHMNNAGRVSVAVEAEAQTREGWDIASRMDGNVFGDQQFQNLEAWSPSFMDEMDRSALPRTTSIGNAALVNPGRLSYALGALSKLNADLLDFYLYEKHLTIRSRETHHNELEYGEIALRLMLMRDD